MGRRGVLCYYDDTPSTAYVCLTSLPLPHVQTEKEGGDGKGAGDGKGGAAAKPKKVQGSKDDIFGAEAGKGRKRTEEGFAIYGEDELGLGKKGGDTDLCPFDCDCCF